MLSRSLPERYAGAISTSHLEVLPTPGDVDMLIASGWIKDRVGGDLLRLRAEWDAAAGDYKLAKRHMREAEHVGRILARDIERAKPEARGALQGDLARMLKSAEGSARTAHALALTKLKTLHEAQRSLGQFAAMLAVKRRAALPPQTVQNVSSRALQVWLDERCDQCGGRGFSGGYTSPKMVCDACDDGRARLRMGDSDQAHGFGRLLLTVLDRKADRTHQLWKRFLRMHCPAAEAADTAALKARLRDLRSTEAEMD